MLPALLVSALLAAAEPVPGPASIEAAPLDACGLVATLAEGESCRGQPLCSQRQRVQLACDVRDALEKRYVFFPVKGRMLPPLGGAPFDSRRHLDACVAEERAIDEEHDPLRFYDRMRRCTAAFADGHLLLAAPARLPQVALGLGLRLVDGRVYIANRERKIVSYLKTVSGVRDLEEILAIGNEVLEIDGQPVLERLREIARHVPASSEAARMERSVDALTRRDFLFPARSVAAITLAVGDGRRTVELP
jgi:hypothetical protein